MSTLGVLDGINPPKRLWHRFDQSRIIVPNISDPCTDGPCSHLLCWIGPQEIYRQASCLTWLQPSFVIPGGEDPWHSSVYRLHKFVGVRGRSEERRVGKEC